VKSIVDSEALKPISVPESSVPLSSVHGTHAPSLSLPPSSSPSPFLASSVTPSLSLSLKGTGVKTWATFSMKTESTHSYPLTHIPLTP